MSTQTVQPISPVVAEWHAQRALGIGGSEMADLFNIAPYGCQKKLWYEKRRIPADYPKVETRAMRRGKYFESLVADLYEEETGRKVRRMPSRVNKDYPWARVNIDRQILAGTGFDGFVTETTMPLEIKTYNERVFRQYKREGIPTYQQLQIQHAMFVTEYRKGGFAGLWADGLELVHFDVARDEEAIDMIKSAGDIFWSKVENGPEPEPLPVVDRRCHSCPWRKTCRGQALEQAIPADQDTPQELAQISDPSFSEAIDNVRLIKQEISELEELKEAEEQKLKDRLGDLTSAETPGYRVYYAPRFASRLDTTGFKKAHPELAAQFTKRQPNGRPLMIYPI